MKPPPLTQREKAWIRVILGLVLLLVGALLILGTVLSPTFQWSLGVGLIAFGAGVVLTVTGGLAIRDNPD
jgi:hypothetical protein